MIQMALNGEGEPRPTMLQVATQAATIELFTQWQTYHNGVHMDWDTFRSIDFRALAIAVMTASGWEFTADEVADMPKLRALLTQPSPFADSSDVHTPVGPPVTLPDHRTIAGIRDRDVTPVRRPGEM